MIGSPCIKHAKIKLYITRKIFKCILNTFKLHTIIVAEKVHIGDWCTDIDKGHKGVLLYCLSITVNLMALILSKHGEGVVEESIVTILWLYRDTLAQHHIYR